jgi:endonuclease-3
VTRRGTPGVAPVGPVMRRLGAAIARMDLPAVEKLSEETSATRFRTLVSVMLSAQTRDKVTEEASRRLFAVASTPRRIAALPEERLQALIYPVSFYRNKAAHLREMSRQLTARFGGEVPTRIDDLLSLPGVGRKTATLVLIVAHDSRDHICVDTHVHRISNRLGWVRTRTPEQTERALYRAAPRRWWADINLHLVTWGQNVCRPVYPLCGVCAVRDLCPRVGVTREGRPPRPGHGARRQATGVGPGGAQGAGPQS